MAREVAVDDVGGVGVGVEVDDPDVAVSVHVGDRGSSGPRDRMVAAENDRHDATRRDLVHALADVGVADLGLPMWAVGVAVVDDLEVFEDLDVEIDVVRARLVRSRSDRAWSETCARPVGCRDVERRPDDRDVGLPTVELRSVGEERALTERGQPAEHVTEFELLVHPGGEVADRVVHRREPYPVPAVRSTVPGCAPAPVSGPKTRATPGGAASLRRRTLPGPPERWSDPPLVDRRALACVTT